jgi:hypothetical protein
MNEYKQEKKRRKAKVGEKSKSWRALEEIPLTDIYP